MSEKNPPSAWSRFWQGLFTYFAAEVVVKGLVAIVAIVMMFWFLRGR